MHQPCGNRSSTTKVSFRVQRQGMSVSSVLLYVKSFVVSSFSVSVSLPPPPLPKNKSCVLCGKQFSGSSDMTYLYAVDQMYSLNDWISFLVRAALCFLRSCPGMCVCVCVCVCVCERERERQLWYKADYPHPMPRSPGTNHHHLCDISEPSPGI